MPLNKWKGVTFYLLFTFMFVTRFGYKYFSDI